MKDLVAELEILKNIAVAHMNQTEQDFGLDSIEYEFVSDAVSAYDDTIEFIEGRNVAAIANKALHLISEVSEYVERKSHNVTSLELFYVSHMTPIIRTINKYTGRGR